MVKRENTLMPMGLDRSKLGQPDERTLYKVQHRGEPADADFFQITVNGNLDDDILQRRIHDVTRQREAFQQMDIELQAQAIARSTILEMQRSCDAKIEAHANTAAKVEV
ncbi:hypothetical protein F3Y22_tig00004045pilonHSYRG00026 [Hibiscus syriacus]|uniref:Uncharacterized protein n=1 Tax=Hibiscus syriacus TaxID=106335 RepID=A0A6A3CHW7_HIBSY|nr:hypothetical protein F3Y22_tig00004045pilonHSYRG00026 [Hibiscus syriacus]